MTACIHCGCSIDPRLGVFPPGTGGARSGTRANPRAPGDHDDVCDVCNYTLGLRGGPDAIPTYRGDHSEWDEPPAGG